ncbi:MAG TPA: response regulator [Elusimicrobiota bacterium]|nr:response regulator [Elusimicrobiota bacterium]
MSPMRERPRLVVVEDDDDFREILCQWLGRAYEVRALAHGESLLDELEESPADILVLDVNLPGPDGFRLCRAIRSRPRLRSVPILFLTARQGDADFLRYLEAGGTAYLTKPVERRELLARLTELTEPSRADARGA